MTKRKVKNITVCVSPEIYRQTRHLAAEYDSTVSTIVAWLLERLPAALERTRFPKGGPKPSSQPTPAVDDSTNSNNLTSEKNPSSEKTAISGRETVTPHLTQEISAACRDLSGRVTAPVQRYPASEPAQNQRLIEHPQNAVQPL
jgi:hypothetical protein